MARADPHSYADDAQPRCTRFHLEARLDFERRVVEATVTHHLDWRGATQAQLDLDTRGLDVQAVDDSAGTALPFVMHPESPILGSRLTVDLPQGTAQVRLSYRTSPQASALQWLSPAQTHGKRHPAVFTQCQAIHARSVVPCQDSPAFRQRYTASLDVPQGLTAVMAAAPVSRGGGGGRARFDFEMPQAIPPYLFAFAVGELAQQELSPRSRVWAEPGLLEAAAWEFAQVEDYLRAAESLFGPYDWERFDLLVMPPSFPYGGMENPRLTFLTPALVTGDRSQVAVVAHELAHAWTGNLVTNANAEHFWLNEGFTVFAERRLVEATQGPEVAALHAALGFAELQKALAQLAATPELTRLRTRLEGVDPDEAFSVVPYEKGYLFLKTLEEACGREPFDALLQSWLSGRRFGAATTEDFLAHLERELPGLAARVDAAAFVDGPGLPARHWTPASRRLDAVRAAVGAVPSREVTATWTPAEWMVFLASQPRPFAGCAALDDEYRLSQARNPEVLVAWVTLALESDHDAVVPVAEEVLGRFGRMKYLKPLYRALAARPATRPVALACFQRYREGYHPIAAQVVGGLLASSAPA